MCGPFTAYKSRMQLFNSREGSSGSTQECSENPKTPAPKRRRVSKHDELAKSSEKVLPSGENETAMLAQEAVTVEVPEKTADEEIAIRRDVAAEALLLLAKMSERNVTTADKIVFGEMAKQSMGVCQWLYPKIKVLYSKLM